MKKIIEFVPCPGKYLNGIFEVFVGGALEGVIMYNDTSFYFRHNYGLHRKNVLWSATVEILTERIITYLKFKPTMKLIPFDIEKAKAGKPVICRDGSEARIICFDRIHSDFSIIALIQNEGSDVIEVMQSYTLSGKRNLKGESDYDLFMAPEIKSQWYCIYSLNGVAQASNLYDSREMFVKNMPKAIILREHTIDIEIND